MKVVSLRSLFSMLFLLGGGLVLAQVEGTEPINILKEKSVVLRTNNVGGVMDFSAQRSFTNIGQIDYYEDEKAKKELRRLEKQGDDIDDLEALDRALSTYIEKFGVENFRRDVGMLWLAGRTKQLLKDTVAAVYYYELAKIHNYGTPAPRMTYDSLVAGTESEWLPIDEYYELLEIRRKIDPLIPPKKVLESMGHIINSDYADYAPFMHPSDSILIFTSRRDSLDTKASDFVDPFAKENEDLFMSIKDFMTGEWQPAERINKEINTLLNEGSASLSPDGKTLIFTRCNAKYGYGDCDIYSAQFDGEHWSEIKNLGKNVNSIYWDSQPNITADGRTIFFSSNRKGGFGGTDLYYTTIGADGKWGPAKNLGPILNSPRNEVTPFFHKINETLYFGSTGQLKNFGGYDIFKARWMHDGWEPPRNIGPLVNTEGNEYYFTISGKGTTIFYSNSRNPEEDHVKQDFDLWSFPMPMESRPDAVAEFRGYLIDSITGNPLVGRIMVIDLENGVEVAPKEINEKGYFEFDLINNNKYRVYVFGDNFLTVRNDFEMTGDTTFNIFTESFEAGKPIVFESLEFASNSTRLRAHVRPKLDYIARFLQTYPMFKLEVEGHTDGDGPPSANLRLSAERAERIATYIIARGEFSPNRVSSRGYGESRPLVPNDTEENKAKNRRVEFRLVWDESYEGDMMLPMEEELYFDDEFLDLDSPHINDEFDWDEEEEKAWMEELEMDADLDLEAELEEDILLKEVEEIEEEEGDGSDDSK
ncbi:MAG: OmpA family protein [Bacteroidota bacterium]